MQLNRALQPAILAISISTRSWSTFSLMIGADVLALSLAWMGSVHMRTLVEEQFQPSVYWQLCPMLGLFLMAYAIVGLYPGVANSPVDELRWTSLSTTLIYLVLVATLFLRREGEIYSREVFIIAWGLSIVLVLTFRALVRLIFAPRSWWGYPVMVLGAGETGAMVIQTLKRRPGIGLKPVLVLDDDPKKHGVLHGSCSGGSGISP
jgi:FlaA1/EpsC-like NDP-sugar epimerase